MFRGIDDKSYLDIINVAYNAKQANIVFFSKLKTMVNNWMWLKSKYKFKVSGKYSGPSAEYDLMNWVTINKDSIFFPKGIRAFSLHSQQEGFEGLNPIFYILDEFAAFKDNTQNANADKIFNSIKTSSFTRFGKQAKGVVISYPRYVEDPIQKLRMLYEDDIEVYTDQASTFEVKPETCFSGDWTFYNNFRIPKEYLEEFEKSPENSLGKYMCLPPESSDPFFTMPEKIDLACDPRQTIFETQEYGDWVGKNKLISRKIIKSNIGITSNQYVITGDLGLKKDKTVVSIWHKETLHLGNNEIEEHLYQDDLFVWSPDPAEKKVVNIDSIKDFIYKIVMSYRLPVTGVYFDHWNSASLIQFLQTKGINADAVKLKSSDYQTARSMIYGGNVHLLENEEQTREMKRLVVKKDGGSDHPPDEHDDMWITTVHAISKLADRDIKKGKGALLPDGGEMVGMNLDRLGGEIVGDMDF